MEENNQIQSKSVLLDHKMIVEGKTWHEKKEMVKFIHSEKATKFCEIFTLLLSNVVPVKSKVKILQNFMAFSEYMNFNDVSSKGEGAPKADERR
jgi:hypothetical protein